MEEFSLPGTHTFGIPTLCCPTNTPVMFWARGRCDGSEKNVTDSPCNSTLFRSSRCLVSLTLYAKNHNVVPAGGTVINHNIPGPDFPLFHSIFSLQIASHPHRWWRCSGYPRPTLLLSGNAQSVFWPLQEIFLKLLKNMGSFTWTKQGHTSPAEDLTQELKHLMKKERER